MKTVYIDSDFKCHLTDDGTLTAVETDFFDGKCERFVDGYRFVPEGKSWTRADGTVFQGKMIAPWEDFRVLDEAQRAYEKQLLMEYAEALKVLGVEV